MTTLLGVYSGERCVGTCDARCYNARPTAVKTVVCLCICGGKNHGVGRERAEANVRDKAVGTARDLELFASVNEMKCEELVVLDRTHVPGTRRARTLAEHELWMRQHQMELPFGAAPKVSS